MGKRKKLDVEALFSCLHGAFTGCLVLGWLSFALGCPDGLYYAGSVGALFILGMLGVSYYENTHQEKE